MNRRVLVVGLIPEIVDYSAFPGLTAEKVRAGIEGQVAKLKEQGYEATGLFVDKGETAEAVLAEELAKGDFGCVVVGAGIRVPAPHFFLFEKLLNVIHAGAPGAKIAFNTNPTDTVDAAARWLP